MWKLTGSPASASTAHIGSQCGWLRSGRPASWGSALVFTPTSPRPLDPLDLHEAVVDVPPRQDRLREQPVARLRLHLRHRVVVDLDGEVAQDRVPLPPSC